MTVLSRGFIEKAIQQFDAGEFQNFILGFLPLYNSKYDGIIRHGQTEFTKTTPGHPDLIKTFTNGDQIGCECSTEKNYWNEKSNYDHWKPIKDTKNV